MVCLITNNHCSCTLLSQLLQKNVKFQKTGTTIIGLPAKLGRMHSVDHIRRVVLFLVFQWKVLSKNLHRSLLRCINEIHPKKVSKLRTCLKRERVVLNNLSGAQTPSCGMQGKMFGRYVFFCTNSYRRLAINRLTLIPHWDCTCIGHVDF